ncbi:MAG: PilC/PilY family type IV pilus protein [Undibacterium sp.]|nr:PilC/PilY family type IV pilus protein [Undibacterium sp.]
MSSRIFTRSHYALVLALLQIAAPVHAVISNVPPLVAPKVAPNVMFTLDNSGSMRWEQMPDDVVGTGGTDDYGFAQPAKLYQSAEGVNNSYTLFETAANPSKIKARRFRSSAVNKMYYNPALRYEPWAYANGSSYPAAVPATTKYNPELPTGVASLPTIDLTVALPVGHTYAGAYVATYYNYIGGGTCPAVPAQTNAVSALEVPACYQKVEIKPGVVLGIKALGRDDCAATVCTYDEELKNFANWFQFWRSRILTARGGVGKAFAKQGTTIRVGWSAINSGIVSKVRNDFAGTNRDAFFNWLYKNNNPSGGTPLRTAVDTVGQYFKTTDAAGPWQNTIGNSTSGQFTCRQNYNILMTDGFWNGSGAGTGRNANYDGTSGSVFTRTDGTTYQYTPVKPYTDSPNTQSDTLADIAMYYWREDLRPTMLDNVPASVDDPAFWQHLVHFTVGLGVNGALNSKTDLPALTSGAKVWPKAVADTLSAVDDLWHAAVNSRGQYFSAGSPKEFADSLDTALKTIDNRVGDAAAVGTSSNTIGSGVKIYTSTYKTERWSGELIQKSLNPVTGAIIDDDWKASEKFPSSFTQRKIFSSNASGNGGIVFDYSNLDVLDKAYFDAAAVAYASPADVTAVNLVDFVRGDRSKEIASSGLLRDRANILGFPTSALGDLVSSDPQYVKEGEDEKYEFLPASSPGKLTYRNFLAANKTRAATVYVGANDGMLHAFDATAGNANSGTERFAYVPKGVMKNLPDLAKPSYGHKFYVNGTPSIGDAFINGSWKTVLLGTTGAGGRTVFALDVTNPTGFDQTKVMWERNETTHVDLPEVAPVNDLGYTFGKPQIGRMKDGRWVAIYGNGYGSANFKASLYVVNLETGALIKRIDTNIGSSTAPNGLSTPKLVVGPDATIRAVYAGDLQGNLWKFDFSNTGATNPIISFGQPLFSAVNSSSQKQPITTQPQIYAHPYGGYMVMFGTGKLFEDTDGTDTKVQSLYGVWDTAGSVASPNGSAITAGNSVLQQQTLSSSGVFVTVTDVAVNWVSKRGWYINLALPANAALGDRVVTDALVIDDQVIFTTLQPGSSTDPCATDGSSTTYQLNPFNGGPLGYKVIDTNNDGLINASDAAVSGVRGTSTFGTTIIRLGNGKGKIYQAPSAANQNGNPNTRDVDLGRSVPTVRIWRQILGKQ